ncbi:3'-5' exonuclease [Novosphingobium bradum]|uniref:DNA 3'-5' helicase n=1 Tax=Novosphingobium bradum TaxID=1737444 RepID=A0ABV7IWL4_9SPHN
MTHLTDRFEQALAWANALHRDQRRKGTAIPYVAHLLGVAAIALEIGADEDQAIAALLHDAVEDQGGLPTLEETASGPSAVHRSDRVFRSASPGANESLDPAAHTGSGAGIALGRPDVSLAADCGMNLLWASTFTDALTKLTQAEAGAATQAALRLAGDPKGNGLSLHRVESAPGFWTARVSRDVRLVLHKAGERTLFAYVGHHDEAYRWAERRRLIQHERTGSMQFVEVDDFGGLDDEFGLVRPTCRGMEQPPPGETPLLGADLPDEPFAELSDDRLLDVGVPRDWLERVRAAASTEVDELFGHLPAEAAEALLDFATGGRLEDHVAPRAEPGADPFAHPDSQRRFRVLDNLEELRAALAQPFEKWAVFLHPAQRVLAERAWTGPARVTGSAGTGKTIVALHRAVHIARADPSARVLLTTFSKPLATALVAKRDVLTEAEPALRERIVVRPLDQAAGELFAAVFGQPNRATESQVRAAIADAREAGLGGALAPGFLFEEWDEVVDAWNVADGEAYAAVPRIGRKTRLGPAQREAAWSVFAFVRERLKARGLVTWAQLYARLAEWLAGGAALPFSHVVVDEAQDLSVAQVRFLAAVGRGRADALFLAGDIGQRIFHLPFSWARLGFDIRGRSHGLKVNYRTSHQIRAAADRLLPPALTDLDGIEEGRRGTISIFDGPDPRVLLAQDEAEEAERVAAFLRECLAQGVAPREIAVLVRGEGQLARARAAVKAAGLDPRAEDGVTIAGMHGAKGLEFRAVAVMACDEEVLPDPERLAAVGDVADLEAAYETERHLLYVACTRARDRLLVSGVGPGSEFLEDLAIASY